MERFFMSLLAIFLPWVALLLEDNIGGAIVALLMQLTVVGWLPASLWAWRVVHGKYKKPKKENVYDELD